MTAFLQIARGLELVREDRKWYENVEAVAEAIRKADADAYERGVNDGLTGRRERGVRILDEYAPPVGPIEQWGIDATASFSRLLSPSKATESPDASPVGRVALHICEGRGGDLRPWSLESCSVCNPRHEPLPQGDGADR